APFLMARASVDRRQGRAAAAESALEDAIGWLGRHPSGALTGDRRRRWRAALDQVYRALVRSKLERGEVDGAYRCWQQFLEADAAILGHVTGRSDQTGKVPAAAITFARLDDRYAVWTHTGAGVKFRWVEGDANTVDRLVRQYGNLCRW